MGGEAGSRWDRYVTQCIVTQYKQKKGEAFASPILLESFLLIRAGVTDCIVPAKEHLTLASLASLPD